MRILVATGGAPHSDAAVRLGALVARVTGAQATLLTVIRHERERGQAEAILIRAGMLMAPEGISAEKRIRTGLPAEEIVREGRDGSFDLIVVGDKPGHGLARRLLTPAAEQVIAHMPCPVLIARGEVQPVTRWLVCEGGREPSVVNRLLDRLAGLLAVVEEVTVLHVMSQIAAAPGVKGWELRAGAEELIEAHTHEGLILETDLERLERLHVRLKAKVRHGLVVPEILQEAQDTGYDLVAIGAHEGARWERYLLDDLAHEIINQVQKPLLIV